MENNTVNVKTIKLTQEQYELLTLGFSVVDGEHAYYILPQMFKQKVSDKELEFELVSAADIPAQVREDLRNAIQTKQ